MIRKVRANDVEAICRIYNHYIAHTIITFEETAISSTDMVARIAECTATLPWLVFEEDGDVLGYAYAGPWKGRSAYRYSVESSVYLDPAAVGRGLGTELYGTLFIQLRSASIHAVIAGITLPNQASVALHEKLGFLKVGHFREIGWKFERWLDVGYWELVL
jgi:L-amino acid N-acyltransferase YncA